MSRLGALFRKLDSHGSAPCFIEEGVDQPYGALLEAVQVWRAKLAGQGIARGTVVALRSDFSLASTALLLALFDLKAVVVLVPSHREAQSLIRECSAEWLCELLPGTEPAWTLLEAGPRPDLLEALKESGDGGVVIFTSGSTGKPKAALQGVERFLAKFDRQGRRMRTLPFLLFDHVAGMDTLFYTLSNGGALVPTRRRDPQSILEIIDANKVEVLPASPSFLRLLCLDAANDRTWPSLKIITYGSEAMDPGTLSRLNARFPNVQLIQKYGTTETGSPSTVSRGNDSLWLRLKDDRVETRIVEGVLWIRSEGTILGYLNAPSPVDAEGWYCTGDRVETDGEWIRFLGRDSEQINVGGEKVAPTEVEQVILELPYVQEAIVRGEAHPLMGQIVTARIVAPDREVEEVIRSVREHCAARLERFKVPIKIEVATTSAVSDRQKATRTGVPDAVTERATDEPRPDQSGSPLAGAPSTPRCCGPQACSRWPVWVSSWPR